MKILFNKKNSRMRRALKTRCQLKSSKSIRLVIHRTSRHMYAQIINFDSRVLTAASTIEKKIQKSLTSYTGNKTSSSIIGEMIAKRAIKQGINSVSFDRSGFKYHGRVRILAETARKSGLKF
ncbi:50S ribosomal protein L18 [Buchnera aphidicola (Myzocallis carpini)]